MTWVNVAFDGWLPSSTGARWGDELPLVSSTGMDDYTRWIEYAPKAYEAIVKIDDDVATIAHRTGWPEYRIKRIKDHLFYKEHVLSDGIRPFDPDPDVADAWARLISGEFSSEDLRLLEHEYFESRFESLFGTDYVTAHDKTIESGRTWSP